MTHAADTASSPYPTVPLEPFEPRAVGGPARTPEEAARSFHDAVASRRSVRMFSDEPVSRETIEWCVRAAGSAPSGANKQPWRFICVRDDSLKARIRAAAEAEECEFYSRRANAQWLHDLKPLDTTPNKGFLQQAPWLIVVFKLAHADDGGQTYYTNESVGIATGLLLAALHLAGLCALTHTPSPMAFLGDVLQRPAHERPYLLIPVGRPATGARVPDIRRKPLDHIMVVM